MVAVDSRAPECAEKILLGGALGDLVSKVISRVIIGVSPLRLGFGVPYFNTFFLKGTLLAPFKGTLIDPFKGTLIDPFKGTLSPKQVYTFSPWLLRSPVEG